MARTEPALRFPSISSTLGGFASWREAVLALGGFAPWREAVLALGVFAPWRETSKTLVIAFLVAVFAHTSTAIPGPVQPASTRSLKAESPFIPGIRRRALPAIACAISMLPGFIGKPFPNR